MYIEELAHLFREFRRNGFKSEREWVWRRGNYLVRLNISEEESRVVVDRLVLCQGGWAIWNVQSVLIENNSVSASIGKINHILNDIDEETKK